MSEHNIRKIARTGMEQLLAATPVKASITEYLKGLEMVIESEPPKDQKADWLPPDWNLN